MDSRCFLTNKPFSDRFYQTNSMPVHIIPSHNLKIINSNCSDGNFHNFFWLITRFYSFPLVNSFVCQTINAEVTLIAYCSSYITCSTAKVP